MGDMRGEASMLAAMRKQDGDVNDESSDGAWRLAHSPCDGEGDEGEVVGGCWSSGGVGCLWLDSGRLVMSS